MKEYAHVQNNDEHRQHLSYEQRRLLVIIVRQWRITQRNLTLQRRRLEYHGV